VNIRAAVAIGLLIVAAAAVSFRGVYEPDLWYHLAQGRITPRGSSTRVLTRRGARPAVPPSSRCSSY
jgi:hypothetical protein